MSVYNRLKNALWERKTNIRLFRENIESYKSFKHMSPYVRESLTEYWDNRILKEYEKCEQLNRLIKKAYSI